MPGIVLNERLEKKFLGCFNLVVPFYKLFHLNEGTATLGKTIWL